MADLTASDVTIVRAWKDAGSGYSYRELILVLDAAGDGTDTIDASTLGFAVIKGCTNLIQSDNTDIINASPNYTGTMILLQNGGATTPLAATGTYRLTVWGTSKGL